ncbi:MAG: methionyl-tRNA formyltransferase [Bacteroidota bacterium]
MKIVFMGTPDFAVGILQELIDQKMDVVAVVTAPDKPAGRGQQLSESAVKKYATSENLNILQPTNLKDALFIEDLKALSADLFVVVAFRMLPEIVWNMPPKGTINLHASLLPNYRGAAPINWAIINGEKKTGVTTFFIEQEIDTGLIIEREELEITENKTAGELHDKLLNLGKKLVSQSVRKIEDGTVVRIPQQDLIDEKGILPAPKIFKPMCEVDFSKDVQTVHNFCRGLSPYPTAWTVIENRETGEKKSLKLFKTEKTETSVENQDELIATKKDFFMPCEDFYLKVLELQPEGKRRMLAHEFLAGYDISKWKICSSKD